MAHDPHPQEENALYGMSPEQAVRLSCLRLAADIAPRLTGGVRAHEVIERARAFELYVAGPPPGNAIASGPADPERGAPEPTESESDLEG